MNSEKRCPGCFSLLDGSKECVCGFQAEEQSPLALPPLTLLNEQYQVGRVLGKPGGFGITYLGWDIRLEALVAIKEYLPRDLAGRTNNQTTISPYSKEDRDNFRYGLEQFLGEARMLARFDHPNIVRVRSFFEQNGTAYLVMDYLKGSNLAEYIAEAGGWIGEEAARMIMTPVMDGLREIHSKGILHRDIKPQNIYLTETGRPILLDFGAARQAMSERSQSLSIIYTAGFAPFEQYHKKGYLGPWTDIYACAATLYFLVTGQPPMDAFERAGNDDLPAPYAINSAISRSFSDIIMQGLAVRPEDRPQDVFLFLEMLAGKEKTTKKPDTAVLSGAKTKNVANQADHGNSDSAGVKTQAGFWSRNMKIAACAAILLMMIGGFGLFWRQHNSTGSIDFADGRNYTGEIRWSKATGNGSMSFPSGRTIKGQFQDGILNGNAALQLPGGYRYEGALKNDKRHGFGKLINDRQQVEYEGYWENDMRNGQGTALLADGNRYTGEFVNDKREGKGKLLTSNGKTIYEGSWQNDEINGQGQLWYADRSRYEGELKAGRRNGYGKLFNSENKLVYEGEWVDNLRHGKGTMIAADGSRKIGAWNYDSFVEPRVVQTPPAANPARPESPATSVATQRREPPRSPKGDPTPQEVFGAFFDIINKFEKR